MSAKRSKCVAYHEAAHAVARVHVGAVATGALIDGPRGISFGTGDLWRSAGVGQYAVWDQLLVLCAGAYAEARVSKQARSVVCLTSGREDFAECEPAVIWLVTHGFAVSESAAWARAERETLRFLREHWPEIERVASALIDRGELNPDEVRRLAA